MHFPLGVLSFLLLASSALPKTVDQYVAFQSPIAQKGLLANIGPDGSKSSGAAPGIVIASPSTSDPDYLFTWVRDSTLVFKHIIDEFTTGRDNSLRTTIDNFVRAESDLIYVDNPSGKAGTSGLGEPKFMIDGTAFTGDWGRPQRDGPALRATAFITYANWLLDNNNASWVSDTLWPSITADLTYVTTYWNQTTFDLWEEVSSSSFFTTAVQHRALREGSALATRLNKMEDVSTYDTQAGNVLCFMQTYWNPLNGYMTSNTGGGRTGIDSNSVLTSIHTYDPEAGCDDITFQPCSAKALSNLKVYVDSFRSVYAINEGRGETEAVATGRYTEDVYYDGNPWYLTTVAVAEQLYDALFVWGKQGYLEVTNVSLSFFQQFSPEVSSGMYNSDSAIYQSLVEDIKTHADGFIAVVAEYTPDDGALAEQYNKENGSPLSAVDLTWSYASILTAFSARNGTVYASWGAKDLQPPEVCESRPIPQVHTTFNVNAETVMGENIFVTGNVEGLANWNTDNAIPMNPDNYPIWTTTANVPPDFTIQYKYIRKDASGFVTWEADPNNRFFSPSEGEYETHDTWR